MKDSENTGAFFGMLGLLFLNFAVLKFAGHWMEPAFSGLAARVLDVSMAAAMPGFVFATQTRPEGWSGWLRLAAGTLLLTGIALLAWLLAALAISAALPPDYIERYGDELCWIGLIPVFLLMFPLAAWLGRIGLLPGFRWRAEESGSPDENGMDEAPPVLPAWYPPGAARRLPAIFAAGGLVLVGDGLFERLVPIWPDSFLSAMDPMLVFPAVASGCLIGFFHKRDSGWLTLLAATLAGGIAMCGVMVAFALALFLLWPGMPAAIFGLLLALTLLLVFLLFVHREFRRDKEKPIPDIANPGEGGKS